MQHSRKRNGFAYVLQPADPGDDALNPHPKTAVRDAAVLAQVQIPSESLFWQPVLANSLDKQIVRGHALRAADDFAIAFRCKHVDAQCQFRTLQVWLHIESFYFR